MRATKSKAQPFEADGLKAQRDYLTRFEESGRSFDLLVADSFVRGMRDLGYKSTAHALNEFIDNSEQAGATTVHVAFGFTGTSEAKPTSIAVIDDGHGMDPSMIRASMLWGGTHREGNSKGFGRYGYGLPSAAVSIAARYTVYSWHLRSKVHAVTFDLQELSGGSYRSKDGRTTVPDAVPTDLPAWLSEYIAQHFPGGMPKSGTVVLLEHLDRLQWKTAKVLREKLTDHFGVTYRNYLRVISLMVDERPVTPLDPLFLTPGARFFANDAEGFPEAHFDVKDPDSGQSRGLVKVRYSYMPPAEFSAKYADSSKREMNRARSAIREQFNGLLVMRNGRQLDVIKSLPRGGGWRRSFQNYDAFYKVEIDFPATLDEEFSVTTAKQQAVMSDRMWELLRQIGVPRMMSELYGRAARDLRALKTAESDGKSKMRPSELVMQEIQRFKMRRPEVVTENLQQEAAYYLQEYVRKRAKESKLPEEVIEQQLEVAAQTRTHVVETEALPGAPFFRVIPRGGQVALLINEGHRFYDDLYAAFESSPQLRAGLELLLFVIGEAELGASGDRRRFYEAERTEWSRVLNTALDRLSEMEATDFETEAEDVLDDLSSDEIRHFA